MILRLINFVVIGALVCAAAYVYRIKLDSTVQAEHLAKKRAEVRRERDRVAALRAEWTQLDTPARIELLANRYLKLKPVVATQFDSLDHLPDQPPDYLRAGSKDPIGGLIEHLEEPVALTGSIPVSGDHAIPPSSPAAASPENAPPPGVLLEPVPTATPQASNRSGVSR